MNKLLLIIFLLLLVLISPAYGQSNSIVLNQESLLEFASSYPEKYNKIMELSNLPDFYRDYKINETYVFFLYKEGPFNVEIVVFKDGIVLDYTPKRYGVSYKDISISYNLNESYQKIISSRSAYINMFYTQYGLKFKRSKLDKEKLIETLIVFPDDTINTNPKGFASEIAENDFRFDLEAVMRRRLDKTCEPYDDFLKYSKIESMCIDISRKTYDHSSNYMGNGVNDFESTLQDLNRKIPHYRDLPIMADKWNEFVNSNTVKNFCVVCYPGIDSNFGLVKSNMESNESYTLANLNEDLPKLNNSINSIQTELENKTIKSRLSSFYNQFESNIIAIVFAIITIIGSYLVIRQFIKERNQIKNEIADSFSVLYAGLNKSIKPILLQIKQQIERHKKEEKH